MPKRFLLVLIFNFVVVSSLFGQIPITGAIFDASNKRPLSGVNICLTSTIDSNQRQMTSTANSGSFLLNNIKEGQYWIRISVLGYRHSTFSVEVLDKAIDFGVILITKKEKLLNEVTIRAEKALIEQKVDRLIINVQNNPIFNGGSALDVLTRSPGVYISAEKQTISLNGREEVLVMINDKLSKLPVGSLIQMLNGLPANSVEKIELISNPGSKYDAGGSGGIINIILKKENNQGVNGAYSLTGGWGGKERGGMTFNINNRHDKVNFYSDFAYYLNHNKQTYDIQRTIFDGSGNVYDHLFSQRDPLSNYYSGKIGLDYDMNKNVTAGFFISGFLDVFSLNANTNDENSLFADSSMFLKIKNKEKNLWGNVTTDAYLNEKLNNKSNLNIDFDYLYYFNKNNLSFINNYVDNFGNFLRSTTMDGSKTGPINSVIASADYSYDISKRAKLSVGIKESSTYYKNDIVVKNTQDGTTTNDSQLSQIFKLQEHISAIYSSYDSRPDEKTEIIAGLRYEYFDLQSKGRIDTITRRSGEFFPSLFISRKLDNKNTLQFSYTRRVSRPSYNDFAPYFTFIDPSTSFTGNQFLNQSISNVFKFDYKYIRYFISFQYTNANHALARYVAQVDVADNSLFYSSVNLRYRNTLSILFSMPAEIVRWWKMQNSVLIANQDLRTDFVNNNISINKHYITFNSTQAFDLGSNYSLVASGFYKSSQISGLSVIKPLGNADLALAKKINARSKLSFSITNVLGDYRETESIDQPKLQFNFLANYEYSPRTFRLTYTHSFGSKNSDSDTRKTGALDEIQGRIR